MNTNQAMIATGMIMNTPTMLSVSVKMIARVATTTPSAIGTARNRRWRLRMAAYSSDGICFVSYDRPQAGHVHRSP